MCFYKEKEGMFVYGCLVVRLFCKSRDNEFGLKVGWDCKSRGT